MKSSTLFALLLGATASGIAADQATEQRPVFRTDVTTVAVYATVQDRSGRLVPDLPREAFSVFSDGRPVDVTLFSNDPQPITAVVLLDMSASMEARHERVHQSVLEFVDVLRPGDRIRIGTFASRASLSPHLTGDKAILRRIVGEELWPGGGTLLWRAIDLAMDSLVSERGRLVVVVLSDGNDSANRHPILGLPGGSRTLVSRFEQDSRFMIYAIGYRGVAGVDLSKFMVSVGGLNRDLTRLASLSGGTHFEIKEDADLTTTFERVAAELRSQYLLGFEAPVVDGRRRRLDVTVNDRGLTVRARRTYVAGAGM